MQIDDVPAETTQIGGTNYQRVRDRLRTEIINGHFAPGARLKVIELAKRYGVSQMPVREAIQLLQGEGLVQVVPNRGATVRVVDRDLVDQILDVRAALEGAIARRVASVITDRELEVVRDLMMRHVREKDDYEAHIRNNLAFHQAINAISRNAEAVKILELHPQILFGLRRRYGFGRDRMDEIVAEHQAVFDALAARDPEAAQKAAEAHVRGAHADLMKRIPE